MKIILSLVLLVIAMSLVNTSFAQQDSVYCVRSDNFTRFTYNTIINRGTDTIEVVGYTKIPPGESGQFLITNSDKEVILKYKDFINKVFVLENNPIRLFLDQQTIVCSIEDVIKNSKRFVLKVEDDLPGQIELNFTGLIKVEQNPDLLYEISLSLTNEKLSELKNSRDFPFTYAFKISARDTISGDIEIKRGEFIIVK